MICLPSLSSTSQGTRLMLCAGWLLCSACGGRSESDTVYNPTAGGADTGISGASANITGGAPAVTNGGAGNATNGGAGLVATAGNGFAVAGTPAYATTGGNGFVIVVVGGSGYATTGGNGFAVTGGSVGTISCANVTCPAIPSSCRNIIQDANSCCPTCTDTGCDPCLNIACPSGMHSETLAGDCCPACVDDPPDACMQGQQSYASMRAAMIEKYGSLGCTNSSDCVMVPENNACVWNCDIPLPGSMASNFVTNLANDANSYCSSCPAPPAVFCERMVPACVNGKCVAANPIN